MLHRRVVVIAAFTGAALVVILTGIAIQSIRLARLRSWYGSCHNHRRFIEVGVLLTYSEQNNGALPHEAGVPGYAMFAKACASVLPAWLNCNHGARNFHVGGWQAVNLSPETWSDLLQQWAPKDSSDTIPFAWCGKPTGTGERVVICVFASSHDAKPSWSWYTRDISEEHLEELLLRLNKCLQAMGEPPTPINVPDHIDWSVYDAGESKRAEGR